VGTRHASDRHAKEFLNQMNEHKRDEANHREAEPEDEEEELHLWGREIDHDDFMKGHYGKSRRQPTPEGGQAGIAQGNTFAQGHVSGDGATPPEDADTFANRDQFTNTAKPRRH
jgi:hypothetical protein